MPKPKRTIVLVVVSGVLLVLLSISGVFPMLVCMPPVTLPPPTVPDYPNGRSEPASLRDSPQAQHDVLVTPDPPEVVLRWYQEQLHEVRGWGPGTFSNYADARPAYKVDFEPKEVLLMAQYHTRIDVDSHDYKNVFEHTSLYMFILNHPTQEQGQYRYLREFIDHGKRPRQDLAGYRPSYGDGTGVAPWCPVDNTPRQWWKE